MITLHHQVFGKNNTFVIYSGDKLTTSYSHVASCINYNDPDVFFTMGHNNDVIRKISLNNKKIVNSNIVQTSSLINYSYNSVIENNPRSFCFFNNGNAIIYTGSITGALFVLRLSAPYDLGTIVFDKSVKLNNTNSETVNINNNGSIITLLQGAYFNIYQLTTPGDIDTAILLSSVANSGLYRNGTYNANGTYYISMVTTVIRLFKLNNAYRLDEGYSVQSIEIPSDIIAMNYGTVSISNDGTIIYISTYSSTIVTLNLTTPYQLGALKIKT